MTHRPSPITFRDALRGVARVALLFSTGSLTLLAGTPDPAAAIRPGTPMDQVVAALGQPEKSDKAGFGLVTNLYYRQYKIVVRGGVVREVKDLNPPPKEARVQTSVAPASPAKRAMEARLKAEAEDGQDAEEGRQGGSGATVAAVPPVAAAPPVTSHAPMPVVVPGPVPPKAAQAAPVPVVVPAPVLAPAPKMVRAPVPAPAPAPTHVVTPVASPLPLPAVAAPAPAEAVLASGARHATPVALGDLPAALAQGIKRVKEVPAEHWTLRLEVANQAETVRKVPSFFKGDRPDVFVLSVAAPGGAAYHVFYGDFATREAAERMARQLPSAFGHPAALQYQKLRSLLSTPK